MTTLFPFLPTPRLTKRFVNVYRLLRVRIASDGDFSAFTDRETGAYRAVLTLLAITVGRSEIAPDLLEAVADATEPRILDWLDRVYRRRVRRLRLSHSNFGELASMAR